MKILYFSEEYGTPTTTFIRNEVFYFKQKHQVKYLCLKNSGKFEDYVIQIPLKYWSVVKKIKWWLWKADLDCSFYNKKFSDNVNLLLNKFQPDIIHCHFGYEALMLIDNIDFTKYKIIIHFHGYDASKMLQKKSYLKRIEFLLKQFTITPVSCNQYFINKISNFTSFQTDRFVKLYCGVDTEFFKPQLVKAKGSKKIFIQISSLVEKKGQEYTLRAFSELIKDPDFNDSELLLTGNGYRLNMLSQLADSLNISERVKFLGTVTPEEARELLDNSDVFVHHSITTKDGDQEGIPTAIMEAMAMELPIVSTFHSGIPELVEDSVNGFLVEEKNWLQMVNALKEAYNLGRLTRNRDKIIRDFSLQIHNRKLEYEIYP